MKRHVVITREEMDHHTKKQDLEAFVCQRLRDHGVPVRGLFTFWGVKSGVIQVRRLDHGGAEFNWYDSIKAAKDDGVDPPDPDAKIILPTP